MPRVKKKDVWKIAIRKEMSKKLGVTDNRFHSVLMDRVSFGVKNSKKLASELSPFMDGYGWTIFVEKGHKGKREKIWNKYLASKK